MICVLLLGMDAQLVVTRQYRPIACSSSNFICVNSAMKADISTVLTTGLVVVHIRLTAVDFLGMALMVDFIVRHDGSQYVAPQRASSLLLCFRFHSL
jgi:hypothetical protein